ncbi:MAG: crossover junction endodeoxyribonuclease RuvC [Bacteroidota bacterium]
MIILGVDPGTLITGYGIIEVRNGKLSMLECDVVKNRSTRSMPIRLKQIYETLLAVIDRFQPDEFAIETAFYGKNAQSALKIGHARGVSILAAVNREIPTTEYSPREVKKAVVGNGSATKNQVQYMVKSLLDLDVVPKFYDATDALAVAICHYHRRGKSTVKRRINGSVRGGADKDWRKFVQAHPERIIRTK